MAEFTKNDLYVLLTFLRDERDYWANVYTGCAVKSGIVHPNAGLLWERLTDTVDALNAAWTNS